MRVERQLPLAFALEDYIAMKTRDLIKMIEADGWHLERVKGSHHIYKHPTKEGTLSLPVHSLGKDVAIGIERSILRQAGLR